jgi:hypothetical protein
MLAMLLPPLLLQLPLLFMVEEDVTEPYGIFHAMPSAVKPVLDPESAEPLTLQLGAPAVLVAAFDPSPLRPDDGYEIFFTNVTNGTGTSALFFATTLDWRVLSPARPPVVVAALGLLPAGASPANLSCIAKSVGRSDDGARYTLMTFCEAPLPGQPAGGRGDRLSEGVRPLVADGATLRTRGFSGPPRVTFHDHDDQQLLWDAPRSRWVDSQITFQNWTTAGFAPPNATQQTKKYCDNAGCLFRRVASARVSADGLAWSRSTACNETFKGDKVRGQESFCTAPGGWNASGLLGPTAGTDPPEEEFYKLSMFWAGGGGGAGGRRLVAHALLYAPAPMEDLGLGYGMMSGGASCGGKAADLDHCHGPHLRLERLVGPASGDPTDMARWRRPYRRRTAQQAPVAPADAMLNVGPVHLAGGLLAWPGGFDTAANAYGTTLLGVPQHRLGGLYAPANAEASSPPFAWPEGGRGLWLDFDAHWEQPPGGTCDQKCQAYVMVAVLGANDTAPIPGYERNKCVMYGAESTNHTLAWRGGNGTAAPPIEPGREVRLRFYWRDALIFAVGAN